MEGWADGGKEGGKEGRSTPLWKRADWRAIQRGWEGSSRGQVTASIAPPPYTLLFVGAGENYLTRLD